ncbi:ZIP-like iron-zinc transporter [Ephemerocybe angulata]|uniref:ZIP-like iron-zinc transporter n=1 Tax=Ephemerocybe angulata TaxID=980116 RepID=A0A8H6M7T6_9AGAR|nr:ZIP-like iron-zinc transporter [Tulosesus angulatus]
MLSIPTRRVLLLLGLLLVVLGASEAAHAQKASPSTEAVLSVYEKDIQECAPIQSLSALKEALEEDASPVMRKVFAVLFPFGPAWNSILGTFYISSVPNFILAFIPAQINTNTLNTMTAFATGGLLSDVFLHLIPHAFMGESQAPGVHFVVVEEKRNIIIGLAIFVGFASFFFMEKTLRVLSEGGDDQGHSHSHSHSHSLPPAASASGVESSSGEKNGLVKRSGGTKEDLTESEGVVQGDKPTGGPSKLSAYLNLFGDFVHNITDGLAMAASFYASPAIGATTTLACFAHEIPHEIADYSILVRSGFTKRQAMQSQFLTAVGAFVGTFIGIAVHNAAATSADAEGPVLDFAAGVRQDANGLFGTTAQWGDLVIPFVAGGFLYIGAVAVLPTLLSESKGAKQALREFAAMAVGVLCMLLVAWNE